MEDVTFNRGPARRPVEKVGDPLLQWSTGLQTSERRLYAGWLVEAGKDEMLDNAMAEAGYTPVTIKHGNGNMVTHWAVETANVFVVCTGLQSMSEMQRSNERYGITFGWRVLDTGKRQSQLRARVFLHELFEVGYTEPLLMSVKGTLTGDLIVALMRQYDVLDAVDTFRQGAGKAPLQAPFYAASIPLGPGKDVTRGSNGQTKEIAPIITTIPDVVTKDYIAQHWTKKAMVPIIEQVLDDTIAWSIDASAQIVNGDDRSAA